MKSEASVDLSKFVDLKTNLSKHLVDLSRYSGGVAINFTCLKLCLGMFRKSQKVMAVLKGNTVYR